MSGVRVFAVCAAILTLVGFAAPCALAKTEKGQGELEIYAGWYKPKDIDGDFTYGLRAGGNVTPRFGIQGSIGHTEPSEKFLGVDVTFKLTLVDASFEWHVNPEGRGVFTVYGGPAWAFVSASGGGGSASDDSFSLHFGVGGKIDASGRVYVRPDARVRWFEKSHNGDVDY